MERTNERGGSRLSTIFWLAVLAAVLYATWNAGPIYFANFQFNDRLQEVARTLKSNKGEVAVTENLARAIKEYELQDYLSTGDCLVTTGETSRTIVCTYEREVKFLPGYKRVIQFNNKVVQPLL